MSNTRLAALYATIAAAGLAGTHPRPTPFDYRTQQTAGDVTVAAEIVPAKQVHNLFSTDLSKYVVVEIAVYPKDGTSVDVQPIDFALKVGSETVRPAVPEAIAWRKHKPSAPPPPPSSSDINVYPTAGVGYESGPYGRGVYTHTGVAVAVGGPPGPPAYPPPGVSDADRDAMQRELQDRQLPEGATSKPVAGYLYFPASSKKKATYDLQYYGAGAKIQLMLK